MKLSHRTDPSTTVQAAGGRNVQSVADCGTIDNSENWPSLPGVYAEIALWSNHTGQWADALFTAMAEWNWASDV